MKNNQGQVQNQLNKLQRNKIYLAIVVLLVLLSVIWVLISITLSNVREQVDPETIKLSKLFTPVIDRSVFETIATKRTYTDEELKLFPIYEIETNKKLKREEIIPIKGYLKLASESGHTQNDTNLQ